MVSALPLFILIPLLGFVLSLLCSPKKEVLLSQIAFTVAGAQFVSVLVFLVYWLFQGFPSLSVVDHVLYETHDYTFYIDFCFDKITAVYLLVGSFLTFLVTIYSRYYLHREQGYKRFFNTILFFFVGYNVTILAGNLETLFIGWEFLGISSFLLIAYYRDRYLPVRNAVKVFSIYRIGDVGLILAMWASHHFWHENIAFMKLTNSELVDIQLQSHTTIGVFISLMILISAAIKSAQLPFSSWLPRAMEGPTPSSAIFYGSLSVHIGVFLLLRTAPFWEHQVAIRVLIGLLGLITAVVANGIARVQSSVKSQIAYSSITQIGLIFIEVAFGLDDLALLHFTGNAFLRTYQLLVSPSVVSYLIREQFNNFVPRPLTFEDYVPKWIENTFFMMCLKEWSLDHFIYNVYWKPLKWIGRKCQFVNLKVIILVLLPLYLTSLFALYHKELLSKDLQHILSYVFAIIGFVMVLKSFAERESAPFSWLLLMTNHFWVALAIGFNADFDFSELYIYLSGIIIAGIPGFIVLFRLQRQEGKMSLYDYQGYVYKYPKLGFVFLMCCLGFSGFPITPTFVGEDVIFTHIHENQVVLAFFVAMSFIVDGLAIIRIYAKIFLGPYVNAPQEMANRAS
jgi:NADH:ubiquinone oxidoreductase subunit 5 (subunit L)/multisubunit Na+/H+ antiporter MnhA subunit